MNILLVDLITFPGNGKLLPGGVLREPVSAVKRADLFVLTKSDAVGNVRKKEVTDLLRKYSPATPVITVRHKPVFLTDVTGASYSIDDMRGRKILSVSGIADPTYFSFLIKKNEGEIVLEKHYSDHHPYQQIDVKAISTSSESQGVDMIITTKKDYVKMRELDISSIEDKLFILNIDIEVEEGKEKLIAGLNRFVNS